jgi:hypothetical protein
MLSAACLGFAVSVSTQVTAGFESINLRENCAQLLQSNSAAQSGNSCGAGQPRGGFGCDAGIESSQVIRSACSCLAGEDSDGSGDARVTSAVRNKPPILVGMPEKVVNNSLRKT